MKYRRTQTFRDDFAKLPRHIQEKVKDKFGLFQQDLEHPSLRIKKMKGFEGIWEGHITREYVFTFHREVDPESQETIIVFRRTGTHNIYSNP